MIREVKNRKEWNQFVEDGQGHPLQLWEWGDLKQKHGPWRATRLQFKSGGGIIGGAQILSRRLPRPFGQLLYIPRGPFCAGSNRVEILEILSKWAKEQGGTELKIEPAWSDFLEWPNGWRRSKNRVLVQKTAAVDLAKDESAIQADFSKKTRQYIRKSESENILIRAVTEVKDLKKCLAIYHETARRADFSLHDDEYYYDLAKIAGRVNQIYLAERDGEPLAFLWNLRTLATEFELYGGVNQQGQTLRANYILKWRAMVLAKQAQVGLYDMNGLLNDGISNFKRGFVREDTDFVGAWDFPLSSMYGFWEGGLPMAKKAVQSVNKVRSRK